MRMGESIPYNEETAVLLLCAKCKQAVKSGENHICKGDTENASQTSEEKGKEATE
jgi:hypothetical protein